MDEGPHPTIYETANWYTIGPVPALGAPWFRDVPGAMQLSAEAHGRIDRWKVRYDAAMAGGPVLSLVELGSLIKRTQAAIEIAGPTDAAILQVQLEDMREEFHMRDFFKERMTRWPAPSVPGQVEPRAEPIDM